MTRFTVGCPGWGEVTIRVWTEIPLDGDFDNTTHLERLTICVQCLPAPRTHIQVAEALLALDSRINAVEVVDERGNGTVVYGSWP